MLESDSLTVISCCIKQRPYISTSLARVYPQIRRADVCVAFDVVSVWFDLVMCDVSRGGDGVQGLACG